MSDGAGWVLFGLVEAAVGAAMLVWPRRMRVPWRGARGRSADAKLEKGFVVVQRIFGLVFLSMGPVVTYAAFAEGGAAPDALGRGVVRVVSIIFAALWSLLGVAMLLWPGQVRSITNPGWSESRGLSLAGSNLTSYRITGLGFIVMGLIVLLVILSAGA